MCYVYFERDFVSVHPCVIRYCKFGKYGYRNKLSSLMPVVSTLNFFTRLQIYMVKIDKENILTKGPKQTNY